jgi:hypothetical protein
VVPVAFEVDGSCLAKGFEMLGDTYQGKVGLFSSLGPPRVAYATLVLAHE